MSRRPPAPETERGLLLRVPPAPTCTAMAGTGSVTGALLSGTVPPESPLVWPLVVLALASMAYDLGVRALRRQNT
ncbi:hypothetical protein P3T27_008086 [Kitasatospora sp. MAA19]|uniref:hypothetical protein n=1 Tax=unclassified Kitasatospora TaxID=2633591 RepID=UPI0024750E8A|nr:hypothetical protein [Kitasatospora sp. MAA19]MDH6711328.1 hypothetical protein [Kitasatospora sp. MAA19]